MIHVNPGVIGGVGGNRIGGLLGSVMALSPAAWYRYGIGLTDAGAGACSLWADQSGNGRDLTAAGAARPTIQSDKSLLFDGVANFMQALFTLNQPCTYYILFKQITWTAPGQRILDGGTAQVSIIQRVASPTIGMSAGISYALDSSVPLGTYSAVAAVFNGASSVLQVNGTSQAPGNAGPNNAGGVTIAAATDDTVPTNIQVKEVILFPTAHDAATRARVIQYLANVGGLSV